MEGIIQGSTAQSYGEFRIYWWESEYDDNNNRSLINMVGQFYCPLSWNHYDGQMCYTNIDGSEEWIELPHWGPHTSYITVVSRSKWVSHNEDGSFNCYLECGFDSDVSLGHVWASGYATLKKLIVKTPCKPPTKINSYIPNSSKPNEYPLDNREFLKPTTNIYLHWSGAQPGKNNSIVGYTVYYKISKEGREPSFNDYSGIIEVNNPSQTNCVIKLYNAPRGMTIKYAVNTKGNAGNGYHSKLGFSNDNNKRINNLPELPVLTYDNLIPSDDASVPMTYTLLDADSKQTLSLVYNTTGNITDSLLPWTLDDELHGSPANDPSKGPTYYFWSYDGIEYCKNPVIAKVYNNIKPEILSLTLDPITYIANGKDDRLYSGKLKGNLRANKPAQGKIIDKETGKEVPIKESNKDIRLYLTLHYSISDEKGFYKETKQIDLPYIKIKDSTSDLSIININKILAKEYKNTEIRYNITAKLKDTEEYSDTYFCKPSNTEEFWYISAAPKLRGRFNQFKDENIPKTIDGHMWNKLRTKFFRDTEITETIVNINLWNSKVQQNTNIEYTIVRNEVTKERFINEVNGKIIEDSKENQYNNIDLLLPEELESYGLIKFEFKFSNGDFYKIVNFTMKEARVPFMDNFQFGDNNNAIYIKPFSESKEEKNTVLGVSTWPFPLTTDLIDPNFKKVQYEYEIDFSMIKFVIERDNQRLVRDIGIDNINRSNDIGEYQINRADLYSFNYKIVETPQEGKTYYEVINNAFVPCEPYMSSTHSNKKLYEKDVKNALNITRYSGIYPVTIHLEMTNLYGRVFKTNGSSFYLDFNEPANITDDFTLQYNFNEWNYVLTKDLARNPSKTYYKKRLFRFTPTLDEERVEGKIYYKINNKTGKYEVYNESFIYGDVYYEKIEAILPENKTSYNGLQFLFEKLLPEESWDKNNVYEYKVYTDLNKNKIQESLYLQLLSSIQLYTNEDIIVKLKISRNGGNDFVDFKEYYYQTNSLSYGLAYQVPSTISFNEVDNNDGAPLPLKIGKIEEITNGVSRTFKIEVYSKSRRKLLAEKVFSKNVIPVVRHTKPIISLEKLKYLKENNIEQVIAEYDCKDLGITLDKDSIHKATREGIITLKEVGSKRQYSNNIDNNFANNKICNFEVSSELEWDVKKYQLILETIANDLASVTKKTITNIQIIYSKPPTLSYRPHKIGINTYDDILDSEEKKDAILVISQTKDNNHIYISGMDANNIDKYNWDFNTKDGTVIFTRDYTDDNQNLKKETRMINFLTGDINNFTVDCGIIDK